MWQQFFLENIHFAVNMFAALVLFAISWLYLDAWLQKMSPKEGLKSLGFALLSLSFIIHGAFLESAVFKTEILPETFYLLLLYLFRFPGYACIIAGLYLDPIEARPQTRGVEPVSSQGKLAAFLAIPGGALNFVSLAFPFLAGGVALLYARRAFLGLERHLKLVSFGFGLLALFELLSQRAVLQNADDPDIYNLVAPFAPLWITEHVVLLLSALVLGRWVFGYLLKRIQTQLFMVLVTVVLVVFVVTAVTFTFLLAKNFQDQAYSELETNVGVLNFAMQSKKEEIMSDALALSQNSQLIEALESGDSGEVPRFLEEFILAKDVVSIVVVDKDSGVVARGEDSQRIGDSLSSDLQVRKALEGKALSSFTVRDGVLAKELNIQATAPISKGGTVYGAVVMEVAMDNVFLNKIKQAANLESSVYGGDTLAATTFTDSHGKPYGLGTKEVQGKVTERVLSRGDVYKGAVSLFQRPFLGVYLPLKAADGSIVGMLFAGREESYILEAAASSIELTFIVTALLILLSIIPAFLLSRYISKQLQ